MVMQQGVHTVEALISRRDLGDSSSLDFKCCHMMHWLVA